MMGRQVQSWRASRNALVQRATKETFNDRSWTFGIIVPRAERATEVARKALADGRPVCILMPTDLVHYTAQEQDGTFDPAMTMAINEAAKLSLMTPGLTWLCLGAEVERNDVFLAETATTPPGPTRVDSVAVGTLEQWIREQVGSLAKERELIEEASICRRESQLVMLLGEDGIARIYVPQERRDALIEAHHLSIGHLAADKTYASLTRNYTWPSARQDVRKHYANCAFCELSKARRNVSHKMWGAVQGGPPHSRWGMDFYGVKTGYVLGHIDLDALHVELQYTPNRTAALVRKSVRTNILNRHGKFDELRSDHAREFMGQVMSMLSKEYGYIHSSTGGYSATGNATMERF